MQPWRAIAVREFPMLLRSPPVPACQRRDSIIPPHIFRGRAQTVDVVYTKVPILFLTGHRTHVPVTISSIHCFEKIKAAKVRKPECRHWMAFTHLILVSLQRTTVQILFTILSFVHMPFSSYPRFFCFLFFFFFCLLVSTCKGLP